MAHPGLAARLRARGSIQLLLRTIVRSKAATANSTQSLAPKPMGL